MWWTQNTPQVRRQKRLMLTLAVRADRFPIPSIIDVTSTRRYLSGLTDRNTIPSGSRHTHTCTHTHTQPFKDTCKLLRNDNIRFQHTALTCFMTCKLTLEGMAAQKKQNRMSFKTRSCRLDSRHVISAVTHWCTLIHQVNLIHFKCDETKSGASFSLPCATC